MPSAEVRKVLSPELRAASCLRLNEDKGQNDSQLVPVDLEARIASAIREAVAGALEHAAQLAEIASLDYQARDMAAAKDPLKRRPSAPNACLHLASEIRALKPDANRGAQSAPAP